jgi:hypothetical protein
MSQINQLYLDYLGRPASQEEIKFYEKRFGQDVDREETLRFIKGAVKSGEISQERANELSAPLGINYEATNFMAGQLADQYAKQRELGYRYQKEGDLPSIFYGQAAKLAANGLTSIYDVGEKDGVLINKVTGEPIEKIGLKGNWKEDPTSINIGPDIQLEDRGKFKRWGFDTSVEGMAHYGIDFQEGVPVFTPYYKDTSTKIFGMKLEDAAKLAIAGTALYFGGSALLAEGGAAAGAGAGTGAGLGGGTGLTAGAGGVTGLTAGTASTGIGAGAIGTGLTAPAGFTLAPGVGASLAAGGAGLGLLDGAYTSSIGETGLIPGAAGEGLQIPTTPGLSSMGGAQGLTVPVAGGVVTELGFVPIGSTPVLGDPGSFINDPNVLGRPTFTTDTLNLPGGTGLDLLDTLQDISQVTDLLGTEQQQTQQQQQRRVAGGQPRGVDFSPLYRNTIVGLLPGAERFRRSLI